MRKMESEADFQQWAVGQMRATQPRPWVQVHDDRVTIGVPDMSVIWNGWQFWIENKYEVFNDVHANFKLSAVRRQQLQWLDEAFQAGRGAVRTGLLAYVRINPLDLTHYVMFIPAGWYLRHVWQKQMQLSALILMSCTVDADDIADGRDLLNFLQTRPRLPEPG